MNAAVRAITDVLQNNRDFKINVIAMITDFRNEVEGDRPAEHQLTAQQIKDLKSRIDAATNGSYTRSIAIHIDPASKYAGTCVDQLKNEVFNNIGNGLEIVPLHNPGPMIGQWFEQLKRDIMVLKLRAIIEAENSLNPVEMKTDVNIDGVVKSRIHWSPSKLYPTLKIDSTYVSQPGFYFVNNKGAFRDTEDRDLDLKLGKIKNEKLLFHHFNDDVNLGVCLPTPYDDELKNLAIDKPIPDTGEHVDKWIFTFPIPFLLCCAIILLILTYLALVGLAFRRNKKLKIRADISVTDPDGEKIGKTRHPQGVNQLLIGKSGTSTCKVEDAEWQVEIKKVESNPFLPWTKPYFSWQRTQGEAYTGGRKGNCQGKFNVRNTSIKLKCGPKDDEFTNYVSIRMLGLK